eukprot:s728_g6.t1
MLRLQSHFLHFSVHLSSLLCRLLPLKNLRKLLEERILTFSLLCLLEIAAGRQCDEKIQEGRDSLAPGSIALCEKPLFYCGTWEHDS